VDQAPSDSGNVRAFSIIITTQYAGVHAARKHVRERRLQQRRGYGTDLDIQDFFACLAGSCCSQCGSADSTGMAMSETDLDIEAFFRVLAGGTC